MEASVPGVEDMAITWTPANEILAQDIAEAEAKLQEKKQWQPIALKYQQSAVVIPESIVTPGGIPQPAIVEPSQRQIVRYAPVTTDVAPVATTAAPAITTVTEPVKPESTPWWQRTLQVFAAPFQWVDDYIIKPGLSTITQPIIPDLKREVGEDYFAWKKREWEAWQTPGVDLDMPWGKWRIDLKGVAEQLPWLLIPGVGTAGKTVGGVTKGAAGIAGMLAKTGTAGRIIGKGLELSPWGIVERTTAKVVGGTAKAVAKKSAQLGEKVGERFVGKTTPRVLTTAETKLVSVANKLKVAEKEFKLAEHRELRPEQYRPLAEIGERVRRGDITPSEGKVLQDQALASVKGIKDKFSIDVSAEAFTKNDVDELLKPLYRRAENDFESRTLANAMEDLLLYGKIPEPKQIQRFAEIYPKEVADALDEIIKLPGDVLAKTWDVMNIARASLSSMDLSATLRQGLILGITRPTAAIKAFPRQLKAFASEKLALQMDDLMRQDTLFDDFVRRGGYIAPIEKAAGLSRMEEAFSSKIAENIPWVRRSERGFVTYLNQLRFEAYKTARSSMVAQGAGDKELKLLVDFVNYASGRGVLPKKLETYAPALNAIFFSPRLQASRIELPVILGKMLLSDKGYMRKEAARALLGFVGGGTAVLGLLNQTGIGTVETDPRSSDFAKLKIGETRFDIWTGYAQYARFVAQMLTSEKKQAYGNMSKEERLDIATRFLQSKYSPAMGLVYDLLKGEDYAGAPIAKDTAGLIDTARKKILPLTVQDLMDAIEQDGMNPMAIGTGVAAGLGIGVLTYIDEFTRKRNKIAEELGYESWSAIDPIKQRELEKLPEMQRMAIEFDHQMMGTMWGDWHSAGRAAEDLFREEVEQATAKYRQSGNGVQYRKDISDAFTIRKGAYAAREKDERFEEIVSRFNAATPQEQLVKLGTEQQAIRIYEEALFGDDMYDEFGDYRWDEAEIRKAILKQPIAQGGIGEELYNYVEEYRGVKYDDFPEEYKELAQAKIALKPYWAVKDQAMELKGWDNESKLNPYQKRWLDSFVGKMRKRMKIIAYREEAKTGSKGLWYYYNKFYTES